MKQGDKRKLEDLLAELAETADFLSTSISGLLEEVRSNRNYQGMVFRPAAKDKFLDDLGDALEGFSNKRTLFGLARKARNSGLSEARIIDMINRWRSTRKTAMNVGYYSTAFRDEIFSFENAPSSDEDVPDGFVFPTGEVWDAKNKRKLTLHGTGSKAVGSKVRGGVGLESVPRSSSGEATNDRRVEGEGND